MKQEKLTEILVLAKRIGNLFNDVIDISNQMAEAIDRGDEVSMKMIVAMRGEPIEKLMIADRALREQLNTLDAEDSARIRAILNGEAVQVEDGMEKLLLEQAGINIRTYNKLVALDQVINRKVAQDKSIYNR